MLLIFRSNSRLAHIGIKENEKYFEKLEANKQNVRFQLDESNRSFSIENQ